MIQVFTIASNREYILRLLAQRARTRTRSPVRAKMPGRAKMPMRAKMIALSARALTKFPRAQKKQKIFRAHTHKCPSAPVATFPRTRTRSPVRAKMPARAKMPGRALREQNFPLCPPAHSKFLRAQKNKKFSARTHTSVLALPSQHSRAYPPAPVRAIEPPGDHQKFLRMKGKLPGKSTLVEVLTIQ